MLGPTPENGNQIVGRERQRVHALAPAGSSLEGEFEIAIKSLKTAVLPQQFGEAITCLGDLFCNQMKGGNSSPLMDVKWKEAFGGGLALRRLQIAAELSRVFAQRETLVGRNPVALDLAERFTVQFLDDLLTRPLHPQPGALAELKEFHTMLPTVVGHLHQCLSKIGDHVNPITENRAEQLGLVALYLMIQNNMSARSALELLKAVSSDPRSSKRATVIERLKDLACDSRVEAGFGDEKMPAPLGRAGFLCAFKDYYPTANPHDPNYSPAVFGHVDLPTSRHYWDYVGQRFQALNRVKDPAERGDRVYRYASLIAESLAGARFIEKEERFFRGLHLHGSDMDPAHLHFYSHVYGVDNGPGADGSAEVTQNLRETSERFRYLAAARYSLNTRKAYARTMESGKWLLEEMAEEVGGSARRLPAGSVEAYPGHGTVLSGIDVGNALDFSTDAGADRYLKIAPWLKAGYESLHNADMIFTRGWIAVARSYQQRDKPPDQYWKGLVDGVPYVAVWFNDHFHNNRLPEVRMWLVPEKVFFDKIQFAYDHKVKLDQLDLTPEGMAEAAAAAGLSILSVGTSSCLYGSFANAWPFGKGSAHGWENSNWWRITRWQDPFHVHRALSSGDYNMHVTGAETELFLKVQAEHAKIQSALRYFEDLHSSFLSVEEAWAKEYARPGENPARFAAPQPRKPESPDKPAAGAGHAEPGGGGDIGAKKGGDGDELFDPSFEVPLSRTRLLRAFIELRNKIAESKPNAELHDFPILELQYTRLFARQGETAFITGGDLCLHLPEGRKVALAGRPGDVARHIDFNDLIEAGWYDRIVSQFAPNNCPRIVFP